MIPRVRTTDVMAGKHLTISGPFVLDTRTFDIPNTMRAFVNGIPDNCVAMSSRWRGGSKMVRAVEQAARKKGIRVIWLR